jgi:hypothetical protein
MIEKSESFHTNIFNNDQKVWLVRILQGRNQRSPFLAYFPKMEIGL